MDKKSLTKLEKKEKYMNRRNFFKRTGVGIASIAVFPMTNLLTQESTIPLYKQFEWVDTPVFIMLKHNTEKNELELTPFNVKTMRTKLCSTIDIDLTNGKIITRENAHTIDERLYQEAQQNGFTHLYCIGSFELSFRDELTPAHRIYFIRGAKVPPEYAIPSIELYQTIRGQRH